MTIVFKSDQIANSQPDLGIPQVVVGRRPWRVDPDEGHHRGDDQQDTTSRLDSEEPHHRASDGTGQGPVAPKPCVLGVGSGTCHGENLLRI